MTLSGGCCCGSVRYETSEQAFHMTTCHCPTCRRACGAASVAWFSVARSGYQIITGTPGRYRSSLHVTRTFCPDCGTQLTYQHDDTPDEIDVTICSLDDPEALRPAVHIFVQHRLSWDVTVDGLPEYQRSPAEGQVHARQ